MSVKVENLTHIYNEGLPHESVAVQDVSFSIEDGQIAGIIDTEELVKAICQLK